MSGRHAGLAARSGVEMETIRLGDDAVPARFEALPLEIG